MKKILLNFVLFFSFCLLQVALPGNFFNKPLPDFLLLFLIVSFFLVPKNYFFVLLLIRGLLFDSLSGLSWGVNLATLFLSFLVGLFLTFVFEKDNVFSRLIIGESILALYYFFFGCFSLLIGRKELSLSLLIIDFVLNGFLYWLIILTQIHVFQKKINY